MHVTEDGELNKEALPPVPDPLLEKIKNTILELYEPVQDATDATHRLSTAEIYQKMQQLYPGHYSLEDVANWLHQKGFTFWDAGAMRWEWLLKAV